MSKVGYELPLDVDRGMCCRREQADGIDRTAEDEKAEGMANAWAQLICAASPRGRSLTRGHILC